MSGPKLASDAAQIVLWFKGLPQPTAFVTTRKEADDAARVYRDGGHGAVVEFQSYPGGEHRSKTIVPASELWALTIEWPSIKLS